MNSYCDIIIPVMTLWSIYDIFFLTGFHWNSHSVKYAILMAIVTPHWISLHTSVNSVILILYFTGYHRHDINFSRRAVVYMYTTGFTGVRRDDVTINSHSDNIKPCMISSEIWYENVFCETTIACTCESNGIYEIDWGCHELFWYHIPLHHCISLDSTGFTGECSDGAITTIQTSYFTGCELQWDPVMTLQ